MGYCWTSGHKKNGKWKFTKCNGNESRGPNDCFPESNKERPRCSDCHEWCKTYSDAVRIIEQYDSDMEEYNNEHGS